ncbi:hypothetical protein MAM1_0004d00493 [Mucor ambiguus]|uniref:SP-RING-type domain-containing protein n=1 Tax=Mucor ambiguus TaxID=91626 RepID=A0A0C9MDK5_9FUNG|nr:hypothetical protein MAM1_0004d00493 [Mucor ambiguus]
MNINLYRRRRLRSTQPILTRVQIKDLGRIIGYTSFRQSVEFLMDPYNYFKLSKVKMAEIHSYLLEKGITAEKCPNSHIRQNDHSRVLISILFPGYPIIKASEHHYQDLRENRSPQAKIIDLAYDQLPTSDKYERLDELFRADVDWFKSPCKDGCYSLHIPLKKLNRSIVVEGHASSNINVRLFLYLWTSERMAWTPTTDIELCIDSKQGNCLSDNDRKIYGYGFKHTDITDKSDAIQKANRRSTSTLSLAFKFIDKQPNIRHVSVCAVMEKSTDELASQLYLQTASLYIGRAMEKSNRNIPVAQQVQQTAVEILNQCNLNDRLQLEKTEKLFLSCAEAFITEWNEHEDEKKDDQDLEIFSGDEVVSVLDPIGLARIQHPARCIFCTHKTTFDAVTFFKFQVTSMIWNCPICSVRIRGIQDMYIDYQTKQALIENPDEEKFLRERNDKYRIIPNLSENKITASIAKKRPLEDYQVISIDDGEADKSNKKPKNV